MTKLQPGVYPLQFGGTAKHEETCAIGKEFLVENRKGKLKTVIGKCNCK